MIRQDDETHTLILRHAADVVVHGVIRGDGSHGVGSDEALLLLKMFKGVDYVSSRLCIIKLVASSSVLIVGNEYGGCGSAGEFDEMHGENAKRRI